MAAVGEDESGRSANHCDPCSVHSTIGSCLLQGSGTDSVARRGSKEQQLLDTIARDLERTIEVRAICCYTTPIRERCATRLDVDHELRGDRANEKKTHDSPGLIYIVTRKTGAGLLKKCTRDVRTESCIPDL